jgi:Tfp pilus assembly protein FimT
MKSKKGFNITEVPQLVIVLLVIAIMMGIGATILTQVQTTQTSGTSAYNITQEGVDSQVSLSGWQSTWEHNNDKVLCHVL